MRDRRTYGLQLQCVQDGTHRLDWYTPRNLDVATAMVEEHCLCHNGYWAYKIFFFGNAAWEPIILDTDAVEEGRAAEIIGAHASHRP